MNDDRKNNKNKKGDGSANDEPGLTQKNTGTIKGEVDLAEDTSFEDSNIERLDDESGKRDE